MKIRLKAALLALALAFLGAGGCTSNQQTTEYTTKIVVQQIAAQSVSYSQEVKDGAVQTLLAAVEGQVTSVYGGNASIFVEDYEQAFYSAIDCCEARSIPQSELDEIVNKLCENSDILAEYLSDKQSFNYYSLAQLFGVIAKITGTNAACLLVYDCSLIYCDYKYEQYTLLYEQHLYPYLQRYAQNWSQRKSDIADIGEENFVNLLKIVVSAAPMYTANYDDGEQLLSGFSAGEAALYLRAQGYMSAKLSLSADNWNFILTSAGESGYFKKLTAIYKIGVCGELSVYFNSFFTDVSYALTKVNSSCAGALLEGDTSAFLKELLSAWSEEEWQNYVDLVNSCKEADYAAYFEQIGVEEAYSAFLLGIKNVTLNQLINASEANFYAALKNFTAGNNAGLAFILFEL